MKREIVVGSEVEFDSEYGPQNGTVTEIKKDIANGRPIALIDVPSTQGSASWKLPIDQLKLYKAAA